jgi:thymidylate synthase (FAD)
MRFKLPKVFMIAETVVIPDGLRAMLEEVGAPDWRVKGAHLNGGGEALAEVAGRLCYKSFGTDLNPNVTRVREGNHDYVTNVVKQQHGSVFEHAVVTFGFIGVSRVFTHEMVRHRAGTAFSQESLRYVRLEKLDAYPPMVFDKDAKALMKHIYGILEGAQDAIAKLHDIDNIKNFSLKKKLTSAFRRLAPIGLSTNIMVTANHRAWRHIIEQRCTEHAEEEIRLVMFMVAKMLKERFPAIYEDMVLTEETATATFAYSKI